jgi:two-component system cell cycle response regulator DivK
LSRRLERHFEAAVRSIKTSEPIAQVDIRTLPESQVPTQETISMNAKTVDRPLATSPAKHPIGSGADRRDFCRVKIVARVHVRGGVGTLDAFEDMAKSIDVTRNGLLWSSSRGGYWVGQILDVMFPYWTSPAAINLARKARVVRNMLQPDFRYAVAVHFDGREDASGSRVSTPYPDQVNVLVVESNPVIARGTRDLLEQDGYRVVVASTAEQALDILQGDTPDVLLAEAEGRGISGTELCAIVKKTLRLKHIPVILLTSSALPSDYSAGYRAGAIVCVPTPCKPEHLQRAVYLLAPPPANRSIYSARINMATFVRS